MRLYRDNFNPASWNTDGSRADLYRPAIRPCFYEHRHAAPAPLPRPGHRPDYPNKAADNACGLTFTGPAPNIGADFRCPGGRSVPRVKRETGAFCHVGNDDVSNNPGTAPATVNEVRIGIRHCASHGKAPIRSYPHESGDRPGMLLLGIAEGDTGYIHALSDPVSGHDSTIKQLCARVCAQNCGV